MASAVSLLLSPPRLLHRDGTSRLLSIPHRRVLLAAPNNATPRRLLAPAPRASNKNDNSGAVEAPDRLVAAVAYLYPFLDGAHHGRFLLTQFPFFGALLRPLAPAARLFHSSPLTPFLLFLTLYFAVVRNQQAFLPLRPLQRDAGRRARRAAHLSRPARAVVRALRWGWVRDLPEHGEHGLPLPARLLGVRRWRLPAREDTTSAHCRRCSGAPGDVTTIRFLRTMLMERESDDMQKTSQWFVGACSKSQA
uniref:Protein TIC 20 n=1 Tax=Zea mays TaxID=4577 RepID=B4FGS1_MAIZE|nr:unknown [Zea mays]